MRSCLTTSFSHAIQDVYHAFFGHVLLAILFASFGELSPLEHCLDVPPVLRNPLSWGEVYIIIICGNKHVATSDESGWIEGMLV
jgi:hypothetical protein